MKNQTKQAFKGLVIGLMAFAAFVIVPLYIGGCATAGDPAGSALHQRNDGSKLDSKGVKNSMVIDDETWTISSDQPGTYAEVDNNGVAATLPGPANIQSLVLSTFVKLGSVNPATTTMKNLKVFLSDEVVTVTALDDDGTPFDVNHQALKSIEIGEYTTDTAAVITAEAGRLATIQQFWITATQAQKEAFMAEVQAQVDLGKSIFEAISGAATSAFGLPSVE